MHLNLLFVSTQSQCVCPKKDTCTNFAWIQRKDLYKLSWWQTCMTGFINDVYIKDEGNFCLLWSWSGRHWGILQKGKLIKGTKPKNTDKCQTTIWDYFDALLTIINTKTAKRPNTKTPIIWVLLPRCIVDKGKLKKGKEGPDKDKGKNKGKDIDKDTDNLTFVTSMHSWQRQTQGEPRRQRGHRRRSKRLE